MMISVFTKVRSSIARIRLFSSARPPPRSPYDEVVQLRGHLAYVYSVAWSPDGGTLASGSGDGTVRLWTTRSLRDVVAARRAAGR